MAEDRPESPPDSDENRELSAGPVFEQVVFERCVWTRPRLLDAGLLINLRET